MTARISRPTKSAMQSGAAKSQRWLLEFVPDAQAHSIEPLMGWTSSADTQAQVKLWFETREDAVAYATRQGLAYRVDEPRDAQRRPMAYSDNFRFDRIGTWTH